MSDLELAMQALYTATPSKRDVAAALRFLTAHLETSPVVDYDAALRLLGWAFNAVSEMAGDSVRVPDYRAFANAGEWDG